MKGFDFPKSYSYRQVWVGRDFKEYLVPTPAMGIPPLEQVDPSSIQIGLGHFGVTLVVTRQTREKKKF